MARPSRPSRRSRASASSERPLLVGKGGVVPPVPPEDDWRKAPYMGVSDDSFWVRVRSYERTGTTSRCPYSSLPEVVPFEEGDPISPSSVSRLEIERGDYPYSFLKFEACSGPTSDWDLWTDDILRDRKFNSILNRAEIMESITICRDLSTKKDNVALRALVSRWSSDSHTFVTSWGEFTPTLEDVCMLMGLPILGRDENVTLKPSARDAKVVDFLVKVLSSCSKLKSNFRGNTKNKANFNAWLRYFYGDTQPLNLVKEGEAREFFPGPGSESPYRLAAYIACWLARYIFPMPPEDGINPAVFPLAVQLAEGTRFALAPLFLGTLYFRLDQIQLDMRRSVGRYEVASYLCTSFMMLFLFERFCQYAPAPRVCERQREMTWAARWKDRNGSGLRLLSVIDEEKEFVKRPFATIVSGVLRPSNFYNDQSIKLDTPPPDHCGWAQGVLWAAISLPSFLPSLVEGNQTSSVVYSPHRVNRQFGLDLVVPVPHAIVNPMSFGECLSLFTLDHMRRVWPGSLALVAEGREGGISTGWREYWGLVLKSFLEFSLGPHSRSPPTNVLNNDSSLRVPKDKSEKGEWGQGLLKLITEEVPGTKGANSSSLPLPLGQAEGGDAGVSSKRVGDSVRLSCTRIVACSGSDRAAVRRRQFKRSVSKGLASIPSKESSESQFSAKQQEVPSSHDQRVKSHFMVSDVKAKVGIDEQGPELVRRAKRAREDVEEGVKRAREGAEEVTRKAPSLDPDDDLPISYFIKNGKATGIVSHIEELTPATSAHVIEIVRDTGATMLANQYRAPSAEDARDSDVTVRGAMLGATGGTRGDGGDDSQSRVLQREVDKEAAIGAVGTRLSPLISESVERARLWKGKGKVDKAPVGGDNGTFVRDETAMRSLREHFEEATPPSFHEENLYPRGQGVDSPICDAVATPKPDLVPLVAPPASSGFQSGFLVQGSVFDHQLVLGALIPWGKYEVGDNCIPLLERVQTRHPETFESLTPQLALIQSALLGGFAQKLYVLEESSFASWTLEDLDRFSTSLMDFKHNGMNLQWLDEHLQFLRGRLEFDQKVLRSSELFQEIPVLLERLRATVKEHDAIDAEVKVLKEKYGGVDGANRSSQGAF